MGLTSLESMDEFIEINAANYRRYREELRDVPGLRVVGYDEREQSSYQYVITEIDEAETRMKLGALKLQFNAAVVTDLDVHAMWLCSRCEHYFVALDETKVHLRRWASLTARSGLGIPIDPLFAQPRMPGPCHASTD